MGKFFAFARRGRSGADAGGMSRDVRGMMLAAFVFGGVGPGRPGGAQNAGGGRPGGDCARCSGGYVIAAADGAGIRAPRRGGGRR